MNSRTETGEGKDEEVGDGKQWHEWMGVVKCLLPGVDFTVGGSKNFTTRQGRKI